MAKCPNCGCEFAETVLSEKTEVEVKAVETPVCPECGGEIGKIGRVVVPCQLSLDTPSYIPHKPCPTCARREAK